MRGLAVLLTMAIFAPPAFGAKRILVAEAEQTPAAAGANALAPVSVKQLEQAIAGSRSLADGKLAEKLSGLELTQRLSASTLEHLRSELSGPQSQQELSLLAARSSFLDLPPSEIPATPAPDVSQQRQMMAAVVAYVTQTVKKLPDFTAIRKTRSFEDSPAGAFSYIPLRFTSESSAHVVYRDGEERDTSTNGKKIDTANAGLVSWGEFGPILSTVLLDAAKSELAWSHWEQGTDGPVAVFRYAVPAKASHYQIQYCCVDPYGYQGDAPRDFRKQARYYGEMAIDPATGAIHRITVIASLGSDDPLVTASIAVHYAPVDIGGKTYISPVRSEAITQRHVTLNRSGTIPSAAISQGPILTRLNEVTFEDYRLFRGDTRVLTDAELAQMTGQPAAAAESETTAQPVTRTAEPAPSAAPAAVAPPPGPVPQPASAAANSAQPAPAPTVEPRPAEAASAAALPAPASASDSVDVPVFRTTARQVLVDVVVGKKNGDPVAGLAKSDFSIHEDGKPQAIDFF